MTSTEEVQARRIGFRDVAEDLRRQIGAGVYRPGDTLPPITDLMDTYGVARQTVRAAIAELSREGLVVAIRKRGTVVRSRTSVRVPLSRYGAVMEPGGTRGPWETACAQQGVDGEMRAVSTETLPAPEDVASILGVTSGSPVIRRTRHALLAGDVVQVQHAWYPPEVASRAGLDSPSKIRGGIYGALSQSGLAPTTADETIRARMPSEGESTLLHTGTGVPLLTVERVTKGPAGKVVELLRLITPADRVEIVYDGLPLR